MASKNEESLVDEGGAELVSPILRDTEQDWESVSAMCEQIKKFPGNKGNIVVADSKCGLHVHFELRMFASKYKLDERRYSGLNLTNIGNSKKNTIEFRMANGTLDPEVIKQNVFLYASLINTTIKMTEKALHRIDLKESNLNK